MNFTPVAFPRSLDLSLSDSVGEKASAVVRSEDRTGEKRRLDRGDKNCVGIKQDQGAEKKGGKKKNYREGQK